MKTKIDTIIRQMTLAEKASLCSGKDHWTTKSIDRLNVPEIRMCDGPNGLRLEYERDGFEVTKYEECTCFPTASALGCSWDIDLIYEIGQAIGLECRTYGANILLAPGINMKRSPLCGRNFEYYSEDPVHSGELGAAFVKGVQSQGVGTSLKHFACNNQEFERMVTSSEVSERVLREIYLTAFERVVKKAQPWTIMCSYNKLNGVLVAENHYLLTQILRDEWGYKGLVVSDWLAVNYNTKALVAGLDLEMPGKNGFGDEAIVEGVKSGEIEESLLNQTVSRHLELVEKVFKPEIEKRVLNKQDHHQLARKAAAESMVLLKNDHKQLPLGRKSRIAIIGDFARNPVFQGIGSSKVYPTQLDTPYEEIERQMDDPGQVIFSQGYNEDASQIESLIQESVTNAGNSEVALVFIGNPHGVESEAYDRKDIDLPESHQKLIEAICEVQKNTIVVLCVGSAVSLGAWQDKVSAIVVAWKAGQASGGGLADVLFGKVNPCGKLAETFPVRIEDTPAYLNFPSEYETVNYGEGLFIGYRYYDKKKIEPLFPFGFGLSYTTFKYQDLKIDQSQINDNETAKVSLIVSNIGSMDGKEIVQLYINDCESTVCRPEKELKHFKKIYLKAGESRQIIFELSFRDFAFYNTNRKDWVVETGDFKILVGRSSKEIELSQTLHVLSTSKQTPQFHKISLIKHLMADEKARKIIEEGMGDSDMGKALHSDDECIAAMALDLPLHKVVAASNGEVTDELLDLLLAEINK